jgi:hypothetical protein
MFYKATIYKQSRYIRELTYWSPSIYGGRWEIPKIVGCLERIRGVGLAQIARL